MHRERLGCLTGPGIAAALITALAIAALAFTQGGNLYSPGLLNAQTGAVLGGVASHAATGGRCEACHTAPWETATMSDRCGSCHGDIVTQMRNVASLHGSLAHDNPNLACWDCHPEHRGATATLVEMNGARFPHEAVGFPLVGSHASVECGACHPNNAFKGTPTTCFACHAARDIHQGQFGTDCAACHTPAAWKELNINHALFAFKLEGKHAAVPCSSCHQNGVFKGTPTDCNACHASADAHHGQFGTACGACHSPAGWTPSTFDHQKSSFPLTGAHVQLQCTQCHTSGQFVGLSGTCVSCHADPAWHAGAMGTDCAACHNTTAYSPALFNRPHPGGCEEGCVGHGGAKCTTCHPVSVFSYTCLACHTSNHPTGN